MSKHENAALLENMYNQFTKGDYKSFLASCADNVTFQVAGKGKLAGKYTKENFESQFVSKLKEFSGGTFDLEVHDVLASDRHAVVLASAYVVRNGEKVQMRTAHVWRMENGKPVAGYEYPRDLYQYDSIWN